MYHEVGGIGFDYSRGWGGAYDVGLWRARKMGRFRVRALGSSWRDGESVPNLRLDERRQ